MTRERLNQLKNSSGIGPQDIQEMIGFIEAILDLAEAHKNDPEIKEAVQKLADASAIDNQNTSGAQ